MTVWTIPAVWLAAIGLATALAGPWMYRTRRGVFLLHWIFVNVVDSSLVLPHINHLVSSQSLLLPLATIPLLLEMAVSAGSKVLLRTHLLVISGLIIILLGPNGLGKIYNQPFLSHEVHTKIGERFILIAFLLSLDALCLIYGNMAHFEITLGLLIILIYLGMYLTFKRVRSPYHMTMQERLDSHCADMFYDWEEPLNCLGLFGKFHFIAIITTLMLQASFLVYRNTHAAEYVNQYMTHLPTYLQVSFLPVLHIFLWLLYIIRSFCTFAMLCTPTFFGGFTNAVKTFGRFLASRKANANNLTHEDSLLENVSN